MVDLREKTAFLFDLNNTLADFHGGGLTDEEKESIGLQRVSDYLEENHRISASASMLRARFLEPWYANFAQSEEDGFEANADAFLLDALNLGPTDIPHDSMIKIFKALMSEFLQRVVVNRNAAALLAFLREQGKQVAVVTNCPTYGAVYHDILARAGLAQYLDVAVCSYDRGYRKPDTRLFMDTVHLLKTAPGACVMVGDSLAEDMVGAQAAGIAAVWYNPNGLEALERTFDYDIGDFAEMIWQ
jgi:FMN phosphatase YigB (HAD superfamily)